MKLTRRSIKWSKLWKCFWVEHWWDIALLPLMHCIHIKQCIKTKKINVRPTKKPRESPMATTSRSSSKQREIERRAVIYRTQCKWRLHVTNWASSDVCAKACNKHNTVALNTTDTLTNCGTLSPLSNHSAKSQCLKQKNHQVCTHAHTKFVQYTCAWTLVDQPASDKEMTHSR